MSLNIPESCQEQGTAIDPTRRNVKSLSDLIRSSKNIVVLTGAGISTPSGIPDFRSAGSGLWQKMDPYQVISLSAFYRDPAIFYDWLHPLAIRLQTAQPNPAHIALAGMEERGLVQAVLTQNIDGLHQRAGSKNVLELHGTLDDLVCLKCGRREVSRPYWGEFINGRQLPGCPACGAVLKPDIVFFEEMLPSDTWDRSEQLCSTADLIMVMGSSLEVFPANQLPLTAIRHGSRLAICNRTPTPLDGMADCVISANIEVVLPILIKMLDREND
ncbi:MAG: NAD-dependent deacetylase [Anaerolineaceae bacterium]